MESNVPESGLNPDQTDGLGIEGLYSAYKNIGNPNFPRKKDQTTSPYYYHNPENEGDSNSQWELLNISQQLRRAWQSSGVNRFFLDQSQIVLDEEINGSEISEVRMDLNNIERSFFQQLEDKVREKTFVDELESVLAENPDDSDALLLLAKLACRDGIMRHSGARKGAGSKFEKYMADALEMLNFAKEKALMVLEMGGDIAEANVILGSIAFVGEEYDMARIHMEEALEIAPKKPDAHTTLASIYKDLGIKSLDNQEVKDEHFRKAYFHFIQGVYCMVDALNGDNDDFQVAEFEIGLNRIKLKGNLLRAMNFCMKDGNYDLYENLLMMAIEQFPDEQWWKRQFENFCSVLIEEFVTEEDADSSQLMRILQLSQELVPDEEYHQYYSGVLKTEEDEERFGGMFGWRKGLSEVEKSFYDAMSVRNIQSMENDIKLLEMAVKHDENDCQAMLLLAKMQFRYAVMLRNAAKKTTGKWVNNIDSMLNRSGGYFSAARELANRALVNPEYAIEARALLGLLDHAEQQYEQSKMWMLSVVEEQPEIFDAHATLASIYKAGAFDSSGKPEEGSNVSQAMFHFKKHIEYLWDALNQRNSLGEVQMHSRRASIKKLEKSLDVALKFCREFDQIDGAADFYALMAEILPANGREICHFIRALITRGKLDDASRIAVNLVLHTTEGSIGYNHAEMLLDVIDEKRNIERQNIERRRVGAIDAVYNAMGELRYHKAGEMANILKEQYPEDTEIDLLMMDICIEGSNDRAELELVSTYLEELYQESVNDPEIGYLLAKVWIKTDRSPEAKELLAELFESQYPNIAEAPDKLIALWFVVSPLDNVEDGLFQKLLISGVDLNRLNAIQEQLRYRLFRQQHVIGFRGSWVWNKIERM